MGGLVYKAVRVKKPEIVTTEYKSLFDISHELIGGELTKIGDLCNKKKCIIVVNVASDWSLTQVNYTELVQLYKEYESQGLQVLAFPCN